MRLLPFLTVCCVLALCVAGKNPERQRRGIVYHGAVQEISNPVSGNNGDSVTVESDSTGNAAEARYTSNPSLTVNYLNNLDLRNNAYVQSNVPQQSQVLQYSTDINQVPVQEYQQQQIQLSNQQGRTQNQLYFTQLSGQQPILDSQYPADTVRIESAQPFLENGQTNQQQSLRQEVIESYNRLVSQRQSGLQAQQQFQAEQQHPQQQVTTQLLQPQIQQHSNQLLNQQFDSSPQYPADTVAIESAQQFSGNQEISQQEQQQADQQQNLLNEQQYLTQEQNQQLLQNVNAFNDQQLQSSAANQNFLRSAQLNAQQFGNQQISQQAEQQANQQQNFLNQQQYLTREQNQQLSQNANSIYEQQLQSSATTQNFLRSAQPNAQQFSNQQTSAQTYSSFDATPVQQYPNAFGYESLSNVQTDQDVRSRQKSSQQSRSQPVPAGPSSRNSLQRNPSLNSVRTTEVRTITQQVPYPVPQPYEVTVTKEVAVPKPYPVEVIKQVPVPYEVRVPVEVPKPYPVRVPHPVPVPVTVKVPVEIPKPYPVHITKTVTVPVEKIVYVRVPEPVKVPVPQPYPVPVPQPVTINVPTPVAVPESNNGNNNNGGAQLPPSQSPVSQNDPAGDSFNPGDDLSSGSVSSSRSGIDIRFNAPGSTNPNFGYPGNPSTTGNSVTPNISGRSGQELRTSIASRIQSAINDGNAILQGNYGSNEGYTGVQNSPGTRGSVNFDQGNGLQSQSGLNPNSNSRSPAQPNNLPIQYTRVDQGEISPYY